MTITRARVWRESKPFLGPAAIVLVYAIVRLGYGAIAGSQGLLTPAGSVDRAQVTLGLAALGLRIFVLVVVVFAVVFRLVMRFLRRWIDPDHG